MVPVLQVEYLARLILWLKKRDWGLALMLAFVSFIAVVWVNVSHPNRLFDALFNGPLFNAGFYIGTIVFPDYTVRGTTGWYVVPLFGAAADFLMLAVFWFVVLRVWRGFRADNADTDLHQPS